MKPLGIAGVSYADLAQPIDTGRNYVVGDKIGRWPLFAKHQAARLRRSACEEFVLLGPVERQIAFAQTRRGERDGEPALQDRVDEKRAQEGEGARQSIDLLSLLELLPGRADVAVALWS